LDDCQFPLDSQFQVYGFNEDSKAMAEGTNGQWIDVSNAKDLERSVTAVKMTVPAGGTSLLNLATAAAAMSPPPDNIYLITDGLPTLGKNAAKGTISGKQRVELFHDASKHFPPKVPINVIMFPLEGDPIASAEAFGLTRSASAASRSTAGTSTRSLNRSSSCSGSLRALP